MIQLKDTVAIVTGGTRGIGFGIAQRLVELGARVVITSRHAEDCTRVATELSANGGEVLGIAADVSDPEACKTLITQVNEAFGRIDILVNNAGITQDNIVMLMREDQWDAVMAVNLKSVYNMSKAILRTLIKQRGGRIINITSVVGEMGNAGQANYAASKAGVIGFTKSLAREIASRGITVNAVAPGYIATEMTDAIQDSAKEKLQSQIPLGRIGSPEDVSGIVAFLASEQAAYITGQVFNVDGGLVMQG